MNNTSHHNGFSVHNGTAGEPMPPKVKPVSSAYSEAAASASTKRAHQRKGDAGQKQADAKQTPTHRRAPKGTAKPAANRTAADRPPVRRTGIAEEVAASSRVGSVQGRRAGRASSTPAGASAAASVQSTPHAASAAAAPRASATASSSAASTKRKASGFAERAKRVVSGGKASDGGASDKSASGRPSRGGARGAGRGAVRSGSVRETARDAARSGASAVDEERASRRAAYEARRQSSLMKYANDNRVVRALYDFTSGPYRAVFYVLVVAVVAIGVYFPVRDLYIAHRTSVILQEQLAIREKYNESLEKEVNKYLSQEGIEEAAREQGMVMPGETPITVQGADQLKNDGQAQASGQGGSADGAKPGEGGNADGDSPAGDAGDSAKGDASSGSGDGAGDSADKGGADGAGSSSSEPSTSAEVERAEREVYANSPWYYKLLDSLFFYSGPVGQIVKSTGE